ncbi:MAG: caspase family protein [Sporocytophaga sp.]|uniref:caspase family protein n=1 Tax=Sporocytophaga sp. TaxID=2231183 RepID=UPI001B2022A5|nr:caspase family protein [Sporocytophaga sp.]MBO9703690.1 caspase family protein [Sporocytophaga sp.]
MNNIAIIIGVSKYTDKSNDLPGCKNDAKAIYQILNKTEKFGNILYINNEEGSANTKELLTNFIAGNKGKEIDEVFFYYSGHGEFINDEFYFLLSDFDPKKRNQTSLQNKEMDDFIRTLNPNLFVKVIDACHSGTAYIKEANVLAKYLDESKKGFRKCYFLNSSLSHQYSYQNNFISDFTHSFICALRDFKSNEIRYKDIIDVIADYFSESLEQTPFFIIQADLTERFCSFTKELKDYLDTIAGSPQKIPTENTMEKSVSLLELVKLDAKNYIDKKGAFEMLELIQNDYNAFQLPGDLDKLFNTKVEFLESYQSIPVKKAITKWLEKNTDPYFVEVVSEENYDYDGNLYWDLEIVSKVDIPYKGISIDLIGLFPNIECYNCQVIFFLSRRAIRFFYFVSTYLEENWDNKKLDLTQIKWITIETKFEGNNPVLKTIQNINKDLISKVENDLKEKFNIEEL